MNKLIIALVCIFAIVLASEAEEQLLSEFTKILDGAKVPSCICNKMYKPVCDAQGKRFSNSCFAKCAGVTEFTACTGGLKRILPAKPIIKPACMCPRLYAPVCDAQGKQYSNFCSAKCAGVTEYKPCRNTKPKPKPSCICAAVYKPVCGKNGITYSNTCRAACSKVEVASEGKCAGTTKPSEKKADATESDACICPKNYAPVCGSNGQTYGNSCGAKCAGVAVVSQGKCGTKPAPAPTSCICPAIYAPVCANGKQYSNSCAAKCDKVTSFTNGPCNKLF